MYAEVLLPLPLQGTFTYCIPDEMLKSVRPGCRVIVPFGTKKFYTGIVENLTHIKPEGFDVKPIFMTLDSSPIIRHPQLKFWNWIAEYYLCSPGDVYKAAIPSGLKVESETFIQINADYEEDIDNPLKERELLILEILQHKKQRMSLAELSRETGFTGISMIVNRMLEKGAIEISERLVERYRSHKERYVRLTATPGDRDAIHSAFKAVSRAEKQETALLSLIELGGYNHLSRGDTPKEVSLKELYERSGVSTAILHTMQKKGILTVYQKEINRFKYSGLATYQLPELTEPQKDALNSIHKSWMEHDTTLLHGVTSSGKTEIYIHLIDYVLKNNSQVLYLVPEIALTTQLTGRLQKVFGDKVVIYHSKFSDNERVDIWKNMLHHPKPCVVIGARSSVFLPFSSLGLVIVDEEHESSYKQMDPAPRYNGRDASLMLARMHGAKALLGSATPAVDTYYKAETGRYGLVELTERYEGMKLPSIELIDMRLAHRKGEVSGTFSMRTRQVVNDAITSGKQAILFLNRRGFAPIAQCEQCGYVPKCEHCDVSLTYHRCIERMVCHYCGSQYEMPKICPACKEPSIKIHGYGTERVEDEVHEVFPQAGISRLDLDTTRNKDGYESIITDFSRGKTDILIGTQMVTKGLDFAGVSAVGVVNADSLVNFPDFRASERAFNMLEQVAGRAGRRDSEGLVTIQTYNPAHPIFSFLQNHDYNGFYKAELEERRSYNYPPFTRIIYVYLKHRDARELSELATKYANRLRELFGTRVNGPDEPHVARVQSLYIRRVMLKIETEASMTKVKQILRKVYEDMHDVRAMRSAVLYYDVDPV